MQYTRKLVGIAFTLCLGITGTAFAAAGNKALAGREDVPLTGQAYEAAKKRIAAQYRADRKACGPLKGQRREVCDAQAEGKEDAARARLEARYRRTPEAVEEAKEVTAQANYKVAREQCEALAGQAEDRCLDEARAAREAAVRQARVEKVDRTGGVFGRKAAGERKPAGGS